MEVAEIPVIIAWPSWLTVQEEGRTADVVVLTLVGIVLVAMGVPGSSVPDVSSITGWLVYQTAAHTAPPIKIIPTKIIQKRFDEDCGAADDVGGCTGGIIGGTGG